MRLPRHRLRSLMILVFLSGLAMAILDRIRRMGPIDPVGLKERLFVLLPFLILVAAKFGLVVWARSTRSVEEDSTPRRLPEGSSSECD